MRKLIAASFLAAFFFTVSTPAQKLNSPPGEASATGPALPLRRVVLYKNGIGYFEHLAKVSGSEELHIDFTTGQLNDVLASLTATDLGGGRVTSVRFNSIAPLGERLRALHLPLGAQTTRQQFLEALRGTPVEVHSGSANVAGKVLSVESVRKSTGRDQPAENVLVLSVISDAGDLRSFELGPGVTVRVAGRELRGDVAQYLSLIGSERAADTRRVTISDEGTGTRSVSVSYVSEVPVWKSTYRILLPEGSDEKPLIQGWAVVDNTLGEDWKDVELSLMSGSPQSFVQNLSVPFYVRRPVVPLPHSVLLSPQTHQGALMSEAQANRPGYGVGAGVGRGVGGNAPGGIAGGHAGGFGVESFGRLYKAPSPPPSPMAGPARRKMATQQVNVMASMQPQATGQELGELFEYDIKNKVTIGKNQSALVPILQSRLDAEKVTLWSAQDPVALRALWISNTTGLALDAGTFNVLDSGAFAGEGLFDTIRPGEKRLISYAADPAVQVATKERSSPELVTRVRIIKGLLITTREEREIRTYRISNSDSKPRVVIIEHPANEGWKLAGGAKPEETTASFYRFKVSVNPKESSKLEVEQVHPELSQIELTNLTSKDVELLSRQRRLTSAMEAAFQKILTQKNELATLDAEIAERQHDVETISRDQARIRENVKALKGGAEEKHLLDRYVHELSAQEDHLSDLRGRISTLKEKRSQAAARLDQTLAETNLDETF